MSSPLAARSVVTRMLVFQFLKLRRFTILLVCFITEWSRDTLYSSFFNVKKRRWHYLQVLTKMIIFWFQYFQRMERRYPGLRPQGMNRYCWMRVGTVVILSYVEYFLSWRWGWLRMDFNIFPQNLLSMVAVSRISCFKSVIFRIIFSISSSSDSSKSLSASSSTRIPQLEMYFLKVSLFSSSWAILPGVPTTMWGILSNSWFCFRQLVPPISRACLRLMFCPNTANCSWI